MIWNDTDVVALCFEHLLGLLRVFDKLGTVDKVGRLGEFGQVCHGCDRVVDRKQQSTQTKLGQRHLEQRFVDGGAGEHSDNLDGGQLARLYFGSDVEASIVPRQAVDGCLSLLVPKPPSKLLLCTHRKRHT